MKISLIIEGANEILYLKPENTDELDLLFDFTHPGEGMTAVLKHGVGGRNPHIEIRKKPDKCLSTHKP